MQSAPGYAVRVPARFMLSWISGEIEARFTSLPRHLDSITLRTVSYPAEERKGRRGAVRASFAARTKVERRRRIPTLKVSHLILDYVAMTEKFGPIDFDGFVELWTVADVLAQETPEDRREDVLASLSAVKRVGQRS